MTMEELGQVPESDMADYLRGLDHTPEDVQAAKAAKHAPLLRYMLHESHSASTGAAH